MEAEQHTIRHHAVWLLILLVLLALGDCVVWLLSALILGFLKPGQDRMLLEPVATFLIWFAPSALLVGAFLPIGLTWRIMLVGAPCLIFGAAILLTELNG